MVGGQFDRYPLNNAQAIGFKPHHLARIIGQKADASDSQFGKDLCPDPILPQVWREPEGLIGLDGVQALLLLKLVGFQFLEQADPPALLAHVENHAGARFHDLAHRMLKLAPAIAQFAGKNISGQALAMDPHEHRLLPGFHHPVQLVPDTTEAQGQMRFTVHHRGERYEVEIPETGRKGHLQFPTHQPLLGPAELDQVRDGAHFQVVSGAESPQIRHPGHGAVLVANLADDRRRFEPSQTGQVHAALGVASPHQNAAIAGPQARDVPLTPHQVGRLGSLVNGHLNSAGTVGCGDTGCDAVPGIYAGGERGSLSVCR